MVFSLSYTVAEFTYPVCHRLRKNLYTVAMFTATPREMMLVWSLQAPLGVGSACTALVGQRLGALQPQVARFTCKVALTLQGKYLNHPVQCSPILLFLASEIFTRSQR